jgi:hypothetical protein
VALDAFAAEIDRQNREDRSVRSHDKLDNKPKDEAP